MPKRTFVKKKKKTTMNSYTHNKICGISESEDHKKYLCISPTMMKKELKYHKL